jgi:hypothetical protein
MVRRLVVTALLFAVASFGCVPTEAPTIGASRAAGIARDAAVGTQPTGSRISNLVVGAPERHGQTWRVTVDFGVVYPTGPSDQPIPVHFIVDVDGSSGRPVIVGQG